MISKDVRQCIREAHLYLIYTDSLSRSPIEDVLVQAVRGGVDLVQIREKESARKRLDLTRRALEALRGMDVPVVVNDDVTIAVEAAAHGVHLGPDDLEPRYARELLGSNMVLGLSTTTEEDAQRALAAGADYLGVGTIFATNTKTGKRIIGPEGAARVCRGVPLPAFPIGGIDLQGAQALARAGCRRAAVCSAILGASDVEETAAAIRAALTGGC